MSEFTGASFYAPNTMDSITVAGVTLADSTVLWDDAVFTGSYVGTFPASPSFVSDANYVVSASGFAEPAKFTKGAVALDGISLSSLSSSDNDAVLTFSQNTGYIVGGEFLNNLVGGTASQKGAAVYVKSNSELFITVRPTLGGTTGAVFSGNSVSGKGAAIYVNSSTMKIYGATFSGNRASGTGGAIFSDKNAANAVTVANTLFSGNVGNGGGAIQSDGGSLSVIGGSFAGNISLGSGGAIYGPANVSGTVFSGNTATSNGGAVATGNASISSAFFRGNTSVTAAGGAVYTSGSASINGSTFINNFAKTNGGAVLGSADSVVSISGSTFIGNTANSGGALRLQGNSSYSVVSNSVFYDNHSNDNSGAIYIKSGALVRLTGKLEFLTASDAIYNAGTLSIDDANLFLAAGITGAATVTNSRITFTNGGAISVGKLTFGDELSSVTLAGDAAVAFASGQAAPAALNIAGNYAAGSTVLATNMTGLSGYTAGGAARTFTDWYLKPGNDGQVQYVTYSSNTLTATVTDTITVGAGSGMAAAADFASVPCLSDFTGNYLVAGDITLTAGAVPNAAANVANDAVITVDGASFITGSADYARALTVNSFTGTGSVAATSGYYAVADATGIDVYRGTEAAIFAPDGDTRQMVQIGGEYYFGTPYTTWSDVTASGKTTVAVSGQTLNATISTGLTLVVGDSLLAGSSNTGSGGAVYAQGVAKFYDSTFSGNSAQTNGGAVHVTTAGAITVSGCSFVNNTAGSNGGALRLQGNSEYSVVSNSVFSGNVAASGGAISLRSGALVRLTGNLKFLTATDTIANDGGTLQIVDANMELNASMTGSVTVTGSSITFGNAAAINVGKLTFSGASSSLIFHGERVTFNNQNLSGAAITVGTGNLPVAEGASYTIASGISAMGETITVEGVASPVTLGEDVVIGGETYRYALSSNALTVTHVAESSDFACVAPDGMQSVVVCGETIALVNRYDTLEEAKAHLNPGGTLLIAATTVGTGSRYRMPGPYNITLAGGALVDASSLYFSPSNMTFEGDQRIVVDHSIIPLAFPLSATSKTTGEIYVTLNGATVNGSFSGCAASDEVEVFCTGVNYLVTDSVLSGNLSGGGSDPHPTVGGDIDIAVVKSNILGYVIGSPANNVTGDIAVTLSGATVGGVAKRDESADNVDADLTLTITGATNSIIGSLFDVDELVITAGARADFTTAQNLTATELTVNASLYAGAPITVATGVTGIGNYTLVDPATDLVLAVEDTNLVLTTAARIIDNNTQTTGSVVGGTVNAVVGGSIGVAFFGTNAASGNVTTTVSGGTVDNALIGGAKVLSGSSADLGTVTLNLSGEADIIGGTANGGMIYTAGYAYGANPDVLDSSATLTVAKSVLNLSAGSVPAQNLYSGAHARKGAYTVVEQTEINVSGGSFGRIYGGGWAEKIGLSEVGSSEIAISGGTVDYIYAGGGNAEGGTTVVNDNVSISVSGSAQVGFAFLAGKNQNCSITGNVTMTVSGIAKSMTRVSGYNANGDNNTGGTTTLDLRTSLDVEYLDHVDIVRIAEGNTLNVSADLWYDAAEALKIDFDLDGALDTDWTAMSGVGMEIYQFAQYTIDGGDVVYTYDETSGKLVNGTTESGYGLDFSEANKVKFVTIA